MGTFNKKFEPIFQIIAIPQKGDMLYVGVRFEAASWFDHAYWKQASIEHFSLGMDAGVVVDVTDIDRDFEPYAFANEAHFDKDWSISYNFDGEELEIVVTFSGGSAIFQTIKAETGTYTWECWFQGEFDEMDIDDDFDDFDGDKAAGSESYLTAKSGGKEGYPQYKSLAKGFRAAFKELNAMLDPFAKPGWEEHVPEKVTDAIAILEDVSAILEELLQEAKAISPDIITPTYNEYPLREVMIGAVRQGLAGRTTSPETVLKHLTGMSQAEYQENVNQLIANSKMGAWWFTGAWMNEYFLDAARILEGNIAKIDDAVFGNFYTASRF